MTPQPSPQEPVTEEGVLRAAMKLLRDRPDWSDDVPEEERLAWWRKAKDVCAAYDRALLTPTEEAKGHVCNPNTYPDCCYPEEEAQHG